MAEKKRLPLSAKEQEVWAYILGYIAENDYPPTRLEIGRKFGYTTQGAESKIQNMVAKGYIKLISGKIRNIEPVIKK